MTTMADRYCVIDIQRGFVSGHQRKQDALAAAMRYAYEQCPDVVVFDRLARYGRPEAVDPAGRVVSLKERGGT